jgi:hypothetical protein
MSTSGFCGLGERELPHWFVQAGNVCDQPVTFAEWAGLRTAPASTEARAAQND